LPFERIVVKSFLNEAKKTKKLKKLKKANIRNYTNWIAML